jgi:hypothetical protein
MRAPHTPPAGPIRIEAAIECLALTLGVNPVDDVAIQAWAAERHVILNAQRKESNDTRSPEWLRRFGDVNPRVRERTIIGESVPSTYVAPQPVTGRPHELRMDSANALLLRAHPALAVLPLHFAMLESLYGLDALEAVKLPGPRTWHDSPVLAEQQRAAVRKRAAARLDRATKLNSDQ